MGGTDVRAMFFVDDVLWLELVECDCHDVVFASVTIAIQLKFFFVLLQYGLDDFFHYVVYWHVFVTPLGSIPRRMLSFGDGPPLGLVIFSSIVTLLELVVNVGWKCFHGYARIQGFMRIWHGLCIDFMIYA